MYSTGTQTAPQYSDQQLQPTADLKSLRDLRSSQHRSDLSGQISVELRISRLNYSEERMTLIIGYFSPQVLQLHLN